MKRSSYMALLLAATVVLTSGPGWLGHTIRQAEAAQSTTKKAPAKKSTKKPAQKKSYCGYPAPPNPAGMSDFCAMQYDFYCRRGVGCNQFGR